MDINIDNYLRINLTDMVLILISTFLIVVIAKRYFWKYVKAYLDGREQHIADELSQSNQNLQDSEVLKAQYEKKIQGAYTEADAIVSKAKLAASQEASEIVSNAKHHAEEVKAQASKDIASEKLKVREQMKEEISTVALLAARKVVGKELDESVHKKYVDDFIEQAGDDSWQA